jgi:hypothetical protein
MSLYEAAALGANMSVPYGAWMGSVIRDSFHPPHELCVEIQHFLAAHEHLFSTRTCSETAVIFSIESNFQRVARRDLFADNRVNASRGEIIPFWQVGQTLSDAAQPYDVVFFPDGELRPDTISADRLGQYRTVILPDCHYLTPNQARALHGYLEHGGRLLILGELGINLPGDLRLALLDHERATTRDSEEAFHTAALPQGLQVRIDGAEQIAIHIQRVKSGAAVHIIRYDYDEAIDRVPPLDRLNLEIRLPERFSCVTAHSAGDAPDATLTVEGDLHRIELRNVPLYTIVSLTAG